VGRKFVAEPRLWVAVAHRVSAPDFVLGETDSVLLMSSLRSLIEPSWFPDELPDEFPGNVHAVAWAAGWCASPS
jgi:hypothetical protein